MARPDPRGSPVGGHVPPPLRFPVLCRFPYACMLSPPPQRNHWVTLVRAMADRLGVLLGLLVAAVLGLGWGAIRSSPAGGREQRGAAPEPRAWCACSTAYLCCTVAFLGTTSPRCALFSRSSSIAHNPHLDFKDRPWSTLASGDDRRYLPKHKNGSSCDVRKCITLTELSSDATQLVSHNLRSTLAPQSQFWPRRPQITMPTISASVANSICSYETSTGMFHTNCLPAARTDRARMLLEVCRRHRL
jgi:hypothetical protein